MSEELKALAEARQALIGAEKVAADLEAVLQATFQGKMLQDTQEDISRLRAEVRALEIKAKAEALAEYEATGNKKPWEGATIKTYKTVDFDVGIAEAWCRKNAPALLSLDSKAYKKTAPALPGSPVTVSNEPRATLSRDLSAYLEGDDGA